MRSCSHSLAISNFLSEVLRDWRGSLELFPANKCRELYWPIPFFGNPATAVVATIGVNPSADEFHPCRNWDAVQDCREWKLRLKNYFTGDIPPHEWFIPWRVGLKLLGVSFEKSTAAHFDISYRPTTAMLRNKNTDAREFREMVEHDLEWFFRLLPLCPNLRGLLVFGPVVRSDGTPESLAGFIRKSAPRHGFKVLADGVLVFDQAGQPSRTFFLHEVSSPDASSVVDQVKESLTRDLDHLKRLLQLPNAAPVDEPQWSKLDFKSLEAAYQQHRQAIQNGQPQALVSRYESIMQFIESDRFWPPTSGAKQFFIPPLCEVLARLPVAEFERVVSCLSFVLEDPKVDALAVNVPLSDILNTSDSSAPKANPAAIVFYRKSWMLSHVALIGLIAHEIAHSFVNGKNYLEHESLVDEKATAWSFGAELKFLAEEKKKLWPQ